GEFNLRGAFCRVCMPGPSSVGTGVRGGSGLCPPTPPTMSDLSLVGGRLCYFFRRRIAAYMYHVDGHVLSLYIMSDQDIEFPSRRDAMLGGRPAAVRELDGFAHILWRDGKLYYSLVSNQSTARLIQLAEAIAMATG